MVKATKISWDRLINDKCHPFLDVECCCFVRCAAILILALPRPPSFLICAFLYRGSQSPQYLGHLDFILCVRFSASSKSNVDCRFYCLLAACYPFVDKRRHKITRYEAAAASDKRVATLRDYTSTIRPLSQESFHLASSRIVPHQTEPPVQVTAAKLFGSDSRM